MNGCEIVNVIKNIKLKPYKCIMVSGKWGIGKTYSVVNSLCNDDNVCVISLFDISNISDIYSELFYELTFNGSKKIPSTIMESFSEILGKVTDKITNVNLQQILSKMITKQDFVLYKLQKLNKKYIIVFDDLERISDSVELRQVFGVIEKLKAYDNVIVIIIANVDEVKEKDVLKRYLVLCQDLAQNKMRSSAS